MYLQYLPNLWPLVISFIMLLFAAFLSLRYRKIKGAKAFGLCMLILGFWILCNELGMSGKDLSTKLFWANMQYSSYIMINFCWFYMALQIADLKKWIRPGRILSLMIIPAIIIILVWTDQYHGLIRYGFTLDTSGSFPAISQSYGPLHWIVPVYGFSIDILSFTLIVRAATIYKSVHCVKYAALLISPVLSIVASVLFIFSLIPIKGYDIMPVLMGIMGIVTIICRYQFCMIVSMVRETAIDNINIGMLVVDSCGNVADANIAACKLLCKEEKAVLGFPVEEVMSGLNCELDDLRTGDIGEFETRGEGINQGRCYGVQRFPVISKLGIQAGDVILIHDVTEIRLTRYFLLKQNSKLIASRERGKIARDLHDNIAQELAFINLQAQGIRNELEYIGTEKLYQELTKLIDISQSAQQEIRKYIHNVRDSSDPEKDYIQMIKESIEKYMEQTGFNILMDIKETDVFNHLLNDQKENVFYIFKEALHNIRKHAYDAKNVMISSDVKNEQLSLVIEDDGNGFVMDHRGANQYGLKTMRERAAEIGAHIEIQSEPGKGTRIKLNIPIMEGGSGYACKNIVCG